MWPFKKKAVEQAKGMDPKPISWVRSHGPWVEKTFCHCGELKSGSTMLGYFNHTVCPECGHKNKWETFTGRYEWNEVKGNPFIRRDEEFIRWTPEHCKVEEPNG